MLLYDIIVVLSFYFICLFYLIFIIFFSTVSFASFQFSVSFLSSVLSFMLAYFF